MLIFQIIAIIVLIGFFLMCGILIFEWVRPDGLDDMPRLELAFGILGMIIMALGAVLAGAWLFLPSP